MVAPWWVCFGRLLIPLWPGIQDGVSGAILLPASSLHWLSFARWGFCWFAGRWGLIGIVAGLVLAELGTRRWLDELMSNGPGKFAAPRVRAGKPRSCRSRSRAYAQAMLLFASGTAARGRRLSVRCRSRIASCDRPVRRSQCRASVPRGQRPHAVPGLRPTPGGDRSSDDVGLRRDGATSQPLPRGPLCRRHRGTRFRGTRAQQGPGFSGFRIGRAQWRSNM